jgi:hypothetical protein
LFEETLKRRQLSGREGEARASQREQKVLRYKNMKGLGLGRQQSRGQPIGVRCEAGRGRREQKR